MTRNFAIAFIATLALSSVAAAHGGHGHGHGKGKRFEQLDTDGNGSISLAELTTKVRARFAKFDANNDGRVTKQEMQAFRDQKRAQWEQKRGKDKADSPERQARLAEKKQHFQARMDERFAELDTNKNGVIDRNEIDGHAKQRFAKLDADKSGSLDRDEMRHGRRFGKHKGMKRGKRGPDHGGAGDGAVL